MNKKNLSFELKWAKPQTKAQKCQKMILPWRYGDPYGRPGDWCRIRETPG